MGKTNSNSIKQLMMKKKSVDRHIIFSTMSLMNTITTSIDISSQLSGAIIEEDLDKIRKDLNTGCFTSSCIRNRAAVSLFWDFWGP